LAVIFRLLSRPLRMVESLFKYAHYTAQSCRFQNLSKRNAMHHLQLTLLQVNYNGELRSFTPVQGATLQLSL
jgi:hypothetical protein